MTNIDDTLQERGARYGEFWQQAAVAQALKAEINAVIATPYGIAPVVREALDHICTKLARIACGDPTYADNWRDISGYATLVLRELEGNQSND